MHQEPGLPAFMLKLYGEFSILRPSRIVPGLAVSAILLIPSGGLQKGMV